MDANFDSNHDAMITAQSLFIEIVKTVPADALTTHSRLSLLQDVSKACLDMFVNMERDQPENTTTLRWLAEKVHEFGNAVRTLEANGLTGDLMPEGSR